MMGEIILAGFAPLDPSFREARCGRRGTTRP
jgi:hypothetical protein